MLRWLLRRPLGWQFGALGLLLALAGLGTVLSTARAMSVRHALAEARAAADMVQHLGAWSARYGEFAVRLRGIDPTRAGTHSERRLYAATLRDLHHLAGSRVDGHRLDRDALDRVDAYYAKSPGLIQQELVEMAARPAAGFTLRIVTAGDVGGLDTSIAFERDALRAFRESDRQEHVVEQGSQLFYARSLTGAEAHARMISIKARIAPLHEVLAERTGPALGMALGAGVLLVLFLRERVLKPLARLRRHVDGLAANGAPAGRRAASRLDTDPASRNEIDRLLVAVARLDKASREPEDQAPSRRRGDSP